MNQNETTFSDLESQSDAYEVIDAGDSVGSSEIETKEDENSLNSKEIFLANRIRLLQHENDKLRQAVQENAEALQLCTTEISSWNENQRKIHNSWCGKYEQAREIVCKLRKDNKSLESQLEELNNRLASSECVTGEQQEKTEHVDQDVADRIKTCVTAFICLSDEQRKEEEARFFDELFKICSQRSPQSTKDEEAISSMKDADERLTVTCAEQKANLEQQKRELDQAKKHNEELKKQLLNVAKDDENDRVRDAPDERDYEDCIRDLKAMLKKEKDLSSKREITFLNERERSENEKKDLRATISVLEEEMEKKTNSVQLKEEVNERNNEIENLKSQVWSFYRELQEKEAESDKWREQEQIYEQSMKNLSGYNSKLKDDLNSTQNKLIQTREEFTLVSVEYEEYQDLCNTKDEEILELRTKCDNLTAQVISTEDIFEKKQHELQKLQQTLFGLQDEHETFAILKQQVEIYQADFNAEKQARIEAQNQCKRLKDEINRLREELSDPTDSRLAELQRRHGNPDTNTWNTDHYLAPRGQPSHHNVQQQVSGGSCPKCERVFDNLDSLQTHLVQCIDSHSDTEEGKCPKCQNIFPDFDTLQIHVMECLDD